MRNSIGKPLLTFTGRKSFSLLIVTLIVISTLVSVHSVDISLSTKDHKIKLKRIRKRKTNESPSDCVDDENTCKGTENMRNIQASNDTNENELGSNRHALIPSEYLDRIIDPQCSCYHVEDISGLPQFAYLIVVHDLRTIEDAKNAFRAIAARNTIILIHIDKSLKWEVYLRSSLYEEVNRCRCGAKVIVDSVCSPDWALWSMNDPLLWAIDILTSRNEFENQWDVFINLSGDTMPTRTPNEMSHLFNREFGPLNDINFITSSSCTTVSIISNFRWYISSNAFILFMFTIGVDSNACISLPERLVNDEVFLNSLN